MLANLLPGLREIRAPLISGYLWLVFFFIAFHDDLPTAETAVPTLKPLFDLGHDLSALGIATVSGVAAYLVGSAVQELLKLLCGYMPGAPFYAEAGTHLSAAGRGDVQRAVAVRVQAIRRRLFQVALSPGEKGVDEEPSSRSIERELPLIRTLLLGEHADLIGELDRLQAEADLRITVAIPMICFAGLFAINVSPLWLLALLPAGLLVGQGHQRQIEAGDLLAKALRIGKVSAPSLESLDTSATAAVERIELEEELARKVSEGKSPMAAFRLGNLQAAGENFEAAITSLRFAAEKGVIHAYAEVGLVYERVGELEDAEQAYRDGEKRKDRRAAERLAELLSRLERDEEALEAVRGIQEGSGLHGGEESKPRVAREGSRIADYRKRLEQGDAKAGINLGLLLARREDWEGAVEAYRRATTIDPNDPQAWLSLGLTLTRLFRLKEAEVALARSLGIREQQGEGDLLDAAEVLSALGGVISWKGDFGQARGMLNRALAIQERELGPESQQVAGTLRGLAASAFDSGHWTEARAMNERALRILERELGGKAPRVASTLGELAYTATLLGDYAVAKEMLDRALPILEEDPGPRWLDLGRTLVSFGVQRGAVGAFEEAREALQRGFDIRMNALGGDHLLVARTRARLAESLRVLGRPDVALREHEDALAVVEAEPGADSTFIEPFLLAARTMRDLGRSDEALALNERALKLAEEVDTYQSIQHASALVGSAEALTAKRSFDIARDQLRHALRLQSEAFGDEHLYTAHTYMAIGRVARGRRHLPEARIAFEKALKALRSASVRHLPLYGEALREAAITVSRQGHVEEADRLAREAIFSLEEGLGETHPQLAVSQKSLASILESDGRPQEDETAGTGEHQLRGSRPRWSIREGRR
jgi:tetratricopeptide (TPR) repeat protein